MTLSQRHLEDIVLGLLSVNSYPVAASFEILPNLRSRGLLDPEKVMAMDVREVAAHLFDAGYRRGGITDIIAPRLQKLMVAIRNGDLDRLPSVVRAGNSREFSALLLPLPGVGPKVVETAWLLLSNHAAD